MSKPEEGDLEFFINEGAMNLMGGLEDIEHIVEVFLRLYDRDDIEEVRKAADNLRKALADEKQMREDDMIPVSRRLCAVLMPLETWLQEQEVKA
jgi:hypothetical protein